MDYDKLSTEELIALKNGEYDKLSTDTLQAIKNAEIDSWKVPVDEQHPNVTFADRAIIKNFASSPESAIAYLKKEHPDMIFRNVDGEIQARLPSEDRYKVIDPSGFDLQDVTDVVSDVGQGVAEAAGTVAGGLIGGTGGAVAGGGVASIPGAIAGSATGQAIGRGMLGGASEYAKQGIGSLLGIPDNINHTNAGISAGASALMPIVGEKVLKPAYNYTKGTVAPAVGSLLSGIDKDILKNINVDDLARNKIASTGATQWLDQQASDISRSISGYKNKLGKAVDQLRPDGINIRPITDEVVNELGNARPYLASNHLPNAEAIEKGLSKYKPSVSGYEMITGNKAPTNIPTSEAVQLRNMLFSYTGKPANEIDYSIQNAARKGGDAVREALLAGSNDNAALKQATDGYSNLLSQLETNPNLKKLVGTNARNDDSLDLANILINKYDKETAKNMGKKQAQQEAFNIVGNAGGPDMNQMARQYNSYNLFNDPKVLPGKNFVENARGAGIGSAIGAGLGYLSGGGVAAGIPLTIGGGVLGEMASSPYVMKGVASGVNRMENSIADKVAKTNAISPYILKSAPKSIYNLMDGRDY